MSYKPVNLINDIAYDILAVSSLLCKDGPSHPINVGRLVCHDTTGTSIVLAGGMQISGPVIAYSAGGLHFQAAGTWLDMTPSFPSVVDAYRFGSIANTTISAASGTMANSVSSLFFGTTLPQGYGPILAAVQSLVWGMYNGVAEIFFAFLEVGTNRIELYRFNSGAAFNAGDTVYISQLNFSYVAAP